MFARVSKSSKSALKEIGLFEKRTEKQMLRGVHEEEAREFREEKEKRKRTIRV